MKITWHNYTNKNKDDLTEAVHGLDIFCKNFCMNCKETEEKGEPRFRCLECQFNISPETGECAIKKFAYKHAEEHNYPMNNFGSMGQL